MTSLVWLTVALPLAGFLVNGGLSLRRSPSRSAVSTVGVGVLAVVAALVSLRGRDA